MTFSRNVLILSVLILFITGCNPVEYVQGDENLSYMKGDKKIGLEMDYSETKVGDQDEEDFIAEKVKEKNEDEEGEGDKWKKKWNNDKRHFNSQFRTKLNEYLINAEEDVVIADKGDEDVDYKILVKVERMEPGFYGGVIHKDAELDTRLIFTKPDGSKEMTVLKLDEAESMKEFMTTRKRLSSAYSQSAIYYGSWIKGKVEE